MKKPTLEEVKEYFKNAKVVKDSDNDSVEDFDVSDIYEAQDRFYIRNSNKIPVRMWGYAVGQQGYAKIILERKEDKKEIVGYKLSKEKYKKVALIISNTVNNWENSREEYDIKVSQTGYINRLTEAGVLDLWFEPVYEEEEEFKVGDIVAWMGSNPKVGKLQHKCDRFEDSWFIDKEHNSCSILNLRHATPEEIEEYNKNKVLFTTEDGVEIKVGASYWVVNPKTLSSWKQTANDNTQLSKGNKAFKSKDKADKFYLSFFKLPTFAGYEGKDEGVYLAWGCYHAYKADLETLVKLGISSFKLKYGSKTIVVGEEDFEIIKKYLN